MPSLTIQPRAFFITRGEYCPTESLRGSSLGDAIKRQEKAKPDKNHGQYLEGPVHGHTCECGSRFQCRRTSGCPSCCDRCDRKKDLYISKACWRGDFNECHNENCQHPLHTFHRSPR